MKRVQLEAIGWVAAGAALAAFVSLPPLGGAAALAYLVTSNVLLLRGMRRRGVDRFGPADVVTELRSTLVGVITGLVAASFVTQVEPALLVALVVPALALDAIDGWVARRTRTTSELGARFDMEVDAFLLLVLSVYVAAGMGAWVLAIGGMRYAFVAAGWMLPWFRRRLPPRYWRKVVTAFAGIALATAASGLLPGVDTAFVLVAVLLLIESFGRDILWLRRSSVAQLLTHSK